MFVLSLSVFPRNAFPLWSNVCGQGKELTQEWNIKKVLHLNRLWPYLQALDWAGRACQGETLQFTMKFLKLRNNFFNIGPRPEMLTKDKHFSLLRKFENNFKRVLKHWSVKVIKSSNREAAYITLFFIVVENLLSSHCP